MKTLILTLFCAFAVSALGQVPPPIVRSPWTTNVVPSGAVATGVTLNGNTTMADAFVTSSILLQGATLTSTLTTDGIATWGSGQLGQSLVGEGLQITGGALSIRKNQTIVNAGTNNAAVTNIFLGVTNIFTVVNGTNNMTSTNLAGLAVGEFHNLTVLFRPQLVNRTNCYPIGDQYGQSWSTNINAPLFTTLTQGVTYVLSLTTDDTNVLASMSVWRK